MKVTRYVNGKRVNQDELNRYVIENDGILKIIRAVNDRLNTDLSDLRTDK